MDRIAEATEYSKGTIYLHFRCKEELILALAKQSLGRRLALFQRAAAFGGRPRERMVAVGEAVAICSRLYPDDPLLFQIINAEAIIQKASAESLGEMKMLAHRCVNIMVGIVRDGVAQGDLELEGHTSPEEMTFALWALTDGTSLVTSWIAPNELGIANPFASIMRSADVLGDGFGWHPLSSEWDYEQTRARVRGEVFPEEARKAGLS
jgi:AcrR family transcriptional regulator